MNCKARKFALENADLRLEVEQLRAERDKEICRLRELLRRNPPKRKTIKQQIKTRLILKQRGLCNICSTQLTDNLWDIDHVVRWADSFNDDEDNLQVLCLPCHRTKTTQECSPTCSLPLPQ